MQEVRLELTTYDWLQNSVRKKTERINALEHELAKVKEDHEAEIEKLTKQGKVRCIYTLVPFKRFFTDKESKIEYKGFDDVKAEVEEHFKQGLFDEELEKYKQEQFQHLVEQLNEKDEIIEKLGSEISRLENRSLIERICNK